MSNEEKVKCLKQIDICNENIRQLEKKIENCNKYISQGSAGILMGIISIILGWYFPICLLGSVFGIAGILLLIINLVQKPRAKSELEAARTLLYQWKEWLYRLES
ncbi:MAG: hypothetical protein AB1345_14270 [Chloroflexota bacterium]